MTSTADGSPGETASGLVGEIETTGIAPIPDARRTMTSGKLFNVWVMSSASALTPLIGALLIQYGLAYMIGAIVVTWALFAIPTGILSETGRELPLTIMVVARRTFGWIGSGGFSVIFTIINIGFFGLNCATGAGILSSLTHTGIGLWYWIVGGIDIVLVVFGMKWLEYFYRYTAALLIACYAALTVYLFTHFTIHAPHQTSPMQWGAAISLVASFSIVGWAYDMSTVSRFAVPRGSERRRAPYFWLPSIGIMLPVLLMGVLGMYSQKATGTWNIASAGHISGWGAAAAVGVTLAIMHTNAMNLYPATFDILVIAKTANLPEHRWEQPVVTVVFGVLGTVLAEAGILQHVQTFLDDIGDFIAPFAFVFIADWLWGLRNRDDVDSYFERPHGRRAGISGSAIPATVATVLGFVVSYWGHDVVGDTFVNDIPMLLVGGLVAFVLYVGYLAVRPGPPALDGAGPMPRAGLHAGSDDEPGRST